VSVKRYSELNDLMDSKDKLINQIKEVEDDRPGQ
jgi:hypothetical protein